MCLTVARNRSMYDKSYSGSVGNYEIPESFINFAFWRGEKVAVHKFLHLDMGKSFHLQVIFFINV